MKNEYTPDRWVVLRISDDKQSVYKILAGWSGSYLHGQSWKLNSGITEVTDDVDYLLFFGYSGSVYRCHKKCYGRNMIMSNILDGFRSQSGDAAVTIEELPEDTNFMELKYE